MNYEDLKSKVILAIVSVVLWPVSVYIRLHERNQKSRR